MKSRIMNHYFILAIAVFSVSTSAVIVKLSSAPSGVIAFYRLFFSVIIMLPFVLKYMFEFRTIKKKDWLYAFFAGFCLAFHFILWFESLNYTSVASSTVLVTLQPLFAFAGTYLFFHERFSWKAIFSGAFAILGSIIISWGDVQISGAALFGDLLAFIACALITLYLMIGQAVRKRLSLITYTFVVYFFSMITLFGYVLYRQESFFFYGRNEWFYFILLALVPTLLGHTLFNWALKWLSTSTISMAILFEPVGAAILAYFLLKEYVLWSQFVGGIIVITGIAFFLFDKERMPLSNKE
ncbi:DMT family transporter [Bacillaceae bacterium Marseille-Q3522]|nr:DMT family transporter [Bacillaceae bacterium Marseille-Q3522]